MNTLLKNALLNITILAISIITTYYYTSQSYKNYAPISHTDSGNFIIVNEKIFTVSELKTDGFERIDILASRGTKSFK
jgi:hypothetical protein